MSGAQIVLLLLGFANCVLVLNVNSRFWKKKINEFAYSKINVFPQNLVMFTFPSLQLKLGSLGLEKLIRRGGEFCFLCSQS